MILNSRKEHSVNKQKEVEERFLELQQVQPSCDQEPRKKRKEKTKKEPQMRSREDPFAKYAAELQIEFFVKVQISTP